MTVNISPDEMRAHLIIERTDEDAVFSFGLEELTEILNQAGITYGLNNERLQKLPTELPLNKSIEIARGDVPRRGADSSFELLFDASGSRAPKVNDDGYIDYKNLNLINNATQGQPLAKKIPATQGKSGMTVTGREVPGEKGKDRALPKGKNTEVSPDNPDLLIATREGAITFANGLISIDNVFKLSSDVDNSTGNIDFVGSLQIAGTVKAGFRVKAEGNIEIGKNIEDAEVVSGGSIIAKGGFVGSGNGVMKANEDVFVKYVENQRIEAGHDVNISSGTMNAQIVAGNAVLLSGHKSVIVGGCVSASNLIEVNTIGSELGTPTLVRVSYDPSVAKEIQDSEDEAKRLQSDNEKIKNAMYSLTPLELDNKLSQNQKNTLAQLKEHEDRVSKQLEKQEEKRKNLLKKLNENKNAKIVVKGIIYPGAVIQIGSLKKEINKVINGCTFAVERDQIVIVSRH